MHRNSIFIAATGQNVGKTTLCLGMLEGLRKRYSQVGFIKPVGQQHVPVEDGTVVDKDAFLFKKHFGLQTAWSDISPVIIPSGFTRDFIDAKICENLLLDRIQSSFEKIASAHDYTIVEGTGHVGVGSIINLNNAQVAAKLNLDAVIIAYGGLGSAHDELSLNIAMCERYGVKVRGVILNRVIDDKREMILDYFPRTLARWKVPLIGCVPFNEFLSKPTVRDFESLFGTNLISGKQHHYRHFEDFRLIAGSLESYKHEMRPKVLVITPATREDIIRETIKKHNFFRKNEQCDYESGMVLTGQRPPSEQILSEIENVDIPILYAPLCSYDAMKKITSHTAKIHIKDLPKIEKAIDLVEKSIDFETLCLSE